MIIDPGYRDMEAYCRNQVEQYLDGLPAEEKIGMCIVSVQPLVPESPQQIQECIIAWIDRFSPTSQQEEETLKEELQQCCEVVGLNVDHSMSLDELKEALRHSLENRPVEQLLRAGVFGHHISQQEADSNRELVIAGYLMHINQAALDQALIELGDMDAVAPDGIYKTVADKFPLLVSMLKKHYLRRSLLN